MTAESGSFTKTIDKTNHVHGGAEALAIRVLRALRSYVTDGEWEDIRSSVPRDLASLLAV
jgi:uncharacterized protein (DUF2267 family)